MSPTVSVVVPAYNNEPFVRQTVRSVLEQTFADFELVVADHSSGDDTWAALQEFTDDPRVTLLRTPAGGGAKRNWDAVSEVATGDLIKLVCGDDVLYPAMLERQVAAFAQHPDAQVVASRRDIIDAQGRVLVRGRGLGRALVGEVDGSAALRASIRAGGNLFGEPMCVMMRTETLRSVGWWDDRQPFYIDLGTYAHALMRGSFVGVDETLAGFRVSAQQWSVRLTDEHSRQAAQFHARVRAEHPDVLSKADVVLGDGMAVVAAARRRLAYAWLGRRMRVAG
ncbi:glycosyltransferase family 2 protein [Cellulomonas rhizosphaerae]|uniref:Glycosyltransferase family 2 protein n=1 Tax=Cellulomonas rhizosphaerae TaxID=2293719 RepID=A0A413RJQ3_9CELL|nr:glycosyltransferase family A protein [Cellulomonas rhizosphaerae]RHA38905.1 glycosyltransferase family 2 protein [Cellulomonas rhizosphaerae]